ncbi:PR-1-like protein [Jackrogersella minutella]|nr:PR-1-like protein [Jackrogersella minutella]
MVVLIPSLPLPALSHSGSRIKLILSSLLLLPPFATSQNVVQTVVITVAPPIPSEAPSFVDPDAFTSAILNSTNHYRQRYNATAVSWNGTLAAFASSYVGARSKRDGGQTCKMAHSGGPYGENLALGCSDAGSCVDMWAGEAPQYDYADPAFTEATGHFTQLVWRNTTDVGCGAKLCPGNYGWYLACEYWPRGNIIGAFGDEVGEPESGAVGMRVDGVLVAAAVLAWWGLV